MEILLNRIFGLAPSSCLNTKQITKWNLTPCYIRLLRKKNYLIYIRCRGEFQTSKRPNSINNFNSGLAIQSHILQMKILQVIEDCLDSKNLGLIYQS